MIIDPQELLVLLSGHASVKIELNTLKAKLKKAEERIEANKRTGDYCYSEVNKNRNFTADVAAMSTKRHRAVVDALKKAEVIPQIFQGD